MLTVHATWAAGSIRLWGESLERWSALMKAGESATQAGDKGGGQSGGQSHPFATSAADLASALVSIEGIRAADDAELLLPIESGRPIPSPPLAHAAGFELLQPDGVEPRRVETLLVEPRRSRRTFESLIDLAGTTSSLSAGSSTSFFAATARLARHLLAHERFVPMLLQTAEGGLEGGWRPWLSDEATMERLQLLLRAMPRSARASAIEHERDALGVVEATLSAIIDAAAREVLRGESMNDAIESADAGLDAQVAWLQALLADGTRVTPPIGAQSEMIKRVRGWIGGLDQRGQSSAWTLMIAVEEPLDAGVGDGFEEPAADVLWKLRFQLRSAEDEHVVVDAEDVWLLPTEGAAVEGQRLDNPHETLLGELGRASRVYPRLERALSESEPAGLELSTSDAYEFLREIRPLLEEQGVSVVVPEWWDSPAMRLGTRLKIDSGPGADEEDPGGGASSATGSQLGLGTLVSYHWEIAVGDKTLTLHEFEQLAGRRAPLVRYGGKWVEIRPEDVEAAIQFIRQNPGGEMAFGEALRIAFSSDAKQTGVPVLGLEVGGWLSAMLDQAGGLQKIPELETVDTFLGTLRPYQARGVSWLAFMEQFGFGACLADDMGLGKTVQLLALLAYERVEAKRKAEAEPDGQHEPIHPTLLVVPMSVVGNWMRECERFCPTLKVLIHHGVDRFQGEELVAEATGSDVVVTTYALANRDKEVLERVPWRRVVLDEAQFIKNPQAKQSQAVRGLHADRRIALTGTPVENRLSELWSIMDFLNPGYLGQAGTFRKKFGVPIERYRDAQRSEQLRSLIRPFVLRRLKTDPTIIADLPEKLETREYCHLTREQATLYETTVKRVLAEVEQSQGIQRRGMVLSALIRLKQICNHPAQALKDHDFQSATPPDASRSGKCVRLLEMMDEVLAAGDKALVFTQFRQMGHLLAVMLRHELDREVLFLHGGTPQKQRVSMIDAFQNEGQRKPIMILSLKAGGVGLNLTGANHVFHFDRWWNPAVENQATDRAFRIGQTRTVQVHKYVVRGTLEERIDEMIEQKTELAESIVGSGERWLTDLSTDDLKQILTLRKDAVEDEEAETALAM
ncbi:MAG: DEAD/DEAH box helicase [Planctomycetota bacterium]